MMYKILLLAASALAASVPLQSQQVIASQDVAPEYRIPTVKESAIMARRILRYEKIGTAATIFPESSGDSRRPDGIGGKPYALPEYFADCDGNGDPTLVAFPIANTYRNADATGNLTLSLRWHPPVDRPYAAAEVPRFSLMGHLEKVSKDDDKEITRLQACYTDIHPDAVQWMPGSGVHSSYWARLIVDEVYWFGGFGDRSYLGWIPLNVFQGVTEEEIDECRLPGEKGYKGPPF